MGKRSRFSPEVRERAMRLVVESEDSHPSRWAAVVGAEEIQRYIRLTLAQQMKSLALTRDEGAVSQVARCAY